VTKILAIKDDGTLLLNGLNVRIPTYWKATDTSGIYECQLPGCKYRRFSYRIKNHELAVKLHCFLQQRSCIHEECQSCPLATPDTSVRKKIEMEIDNGDGTKTTTQIVMCVDPNTDPRLQTLGTWIPTHDTETKARPVARPDLQAIQDTLSPFKAGRDRKFRIEEDGMIVYEKEEGEWETPKDINGYRRDPNNPWRFIPLWPPCVMRHQIGIRYANCGCINVIMRCNHPEHPKYVDRIGHEDCQACPLRIASKSEN